MNLDRVKKARQLFVEKGSKRKAGKYGNAEAKALAAEYDAANEANEVMVGAEEPKETTFEDKIKKGRKSKVAKLRAGY